jgi:hypothetical protein
MAKALSMVLSRSARVGIGSDAQDYLAPAWTKTLAKGGRFPHRSRRWTLQPHRSKRRD